MIPSDWGKIEGTARFAFEGIDYTPDQLLGLNIKGYNTYYFPNHPSAEAYALMPLNPKSKSNRKIPVSGEYIDTWEYVFVDLDMKDFNTGTSRSHNYETKDQFIEAILSAGLPPSKIIDSGGGVHVYWRVSDLDAMSFLRLNRRLCRKFHSDDAVSKLAQLMRVPNTLNVKVKDQFKLCEILLDAEENVYDCETLDKFLPPIKVEDETYCQTHYDMVHNSNSTVNSVSEELPAKFLHLCKSNREVHALFYEAHKDRSSADFRLAHLMQAAGLSKEEARIPLMQTSKSSERSKVHRYSYAENIINKIWVELPDRDAKPFIHLSKTLTQLLNKDPGQTNEATRFPCNELIDASEHGFRLSEVMGLIGGTGNGKSILSMNIFLWFIERNPDYDHLYVTLEMPEKDIASRWDKMTSGSGRECLKDKVHILGNYNEDGTYRNLSLGDIQEYVLNLEKHLKRKIGCTVIDHIGVLKQEKRQGEFDGLRGVFKSLKAFTIATNTFLIIQSQTTREKNGGGDVELDIDSAFGGSDFENYCDYIFTCFQPLKRVYQRAPNMTITAFKKAKDRHKNVLKDKMQCDQVYALYFDPNTNLLRELTSDEHKAYEFWAAQANSLRNRDKKKEANQITAISWTTNK